MKEVSVEKGVEAIIFLQKMVGIDEPVEKATDSWNSFSDWEKERTLEVHGIMNPGKN